MYTTRNSHAIRFRDDGTFHSYLLHLSIYLSIRISHRRSFPGDARIAARTTFPFPVHLIRSPPPKSFLSRHTLPEKLAVWRSHIFAGRQLRAHIPQATTARRRRSSRIRHFYAVACIVYPRVRASINARTSAEDSQAAVHTMLGVVNMQLSALAWLSPH